MKKLKAKVNKKLLPLIFFLLAAVLFCIIYTIAVGGHYDMKTSLFLPELDNKDVSAEFENKGVVRFSGARLSDFGYDDSKGVILSFDAVSEGETKVRVVYDRYAGADQHRMTYEYNLKVNSFGVILDTTYSAADYQAYPVILIVSMLMLLAVVLTLLVCFIDCKKKGDFGYRMIVYFGSMCFIGILLAFLVYKWLNHALMNPEAFIGVFLDIGYEVFLLIAPLMLMLSLLLAISNIWLLRHEGFRPVNALGIAFGFVCSVGVVLILFADVLPSVSKIVNPDIIRRILLYVFCYFGIMFIATVLCAYLSTKHRPPYDRDYIIILGCAINRDGTLTPLLRGRADAALQFEKEQFEKTGKHAIFVPSGGQGDDEVISESRAMTNYLIEHGIPEERILPEDKSVNTMQNMQFSGKVIKAHAGDLANCKIAFATTNYHIFRGYILSKKNGFTAKGISAKTKEYFFPNAFLREFVGMLADRKYLHILFVLLTLAVFVLFYYLQ